MADTHNTTTTNAAAKGIETSLHLDGGLSGNGSLHISVPGHDPLIVQIGYLTPAIQEQALLHGLKQKIVDAAALSRNPDTGRSATWSDKHSAMVEVLNRLLAGQWNKSRGDGSGASGAGGLLFSALCRLYSGKSAEEIRAFLEGKTKAEQAALRKNPRVADMIETIKAERAKDGGDGDAGDDLLAELDGTNPREDDEAGIF